MARGYNAQMSLNPHSFVDRIARVLGRPSAEFRVLGACLISLHGVMIQGPETPVGRMIMLVHLGLFLLWQPVVRAGYRFRWTNGLAVVAAAAAMSFFLSWALLALWLTILASVISGAAFLSGSGRARLAYRMALAYLVVSLLIIVVPQLVSVRAEVLELFWWLSVTALPALMLGVAVIPSSHVQPRPRGVDFISAALVFLMLTVMVLGALVAMWLMALPYLVAVVFALFTTAASLAAMAWAWDPRMGGPQLGAQFVRRVLSAEMSFEEWLHEVALLSVANEDPDIFLDAACRQMQQLPGVKGGYWQVPGSEGRFGDATDKAVRKHAEPLTLTLYLAQMPSAAMDWHFDLTVRVVAQFYLEKRHAQELESVSYLRALHETGARLTHDVKNLLQSLNTLCYTATQDATDEAQLKALVGRQLPVIASRLSATLEKLRVPAPHVAAHMPARQWWAQAKERHAGSPVDFEGVPGEVEVSAGLFDAALDNLVQNALDKRGACPEIGIRVRFGEDDHRPWLEVEDSGPAVAAGIASHLFARRLPSDSGLGVGLYQLAQLADALGFIIQLVCNEPGCVRFRLAQADAEVDLRPARRASS